MNSKVQISIVEGDALKVEADVLALKFAQQHHGVDSIIAERLVQAGIDEGAMRPRDGEFQLVRSRGAIGATSALFVGVVRLNDFQYREIRDFARRVLSSLARSAPDARHVAVTMHGANYGLDEIEAFEAEVAGFLDAIGAGDFPEKLEKISVVEVSHGRVSRLRPVLDELYPNASAHSASVEVGEATIDRLRAAGYASEAKSHVFVAMPFRDGMEDVYHYGIQSAVREAGFLCERADLSSFVGDVMHWVQNRIRTASLVVADLTDANPNVYLEVGYAWGCGIPAVLIVNDSDALKFDVRGQRCLVYKSIRKLEEALRAELKKLRESGAV